jgi:hypothetical protein
MLGGNFAEDIKGDVAVSPLDTPMGFQSKLPEAKREPLTPSDASGSWSL